MLCQTHECKPCDLLLMLGCKQLESWLWHLWYDIEVYEYLTYIKSILSHNYTYIESSQILLQYVYHCLLKKADPNHPNIPILRLHAMPCPVVRWNYGIHRGLALALCVTPPHFFDLKKTSPHFVKLPNGTLFGTVFWLELKKVSWEFQGRPSRLKEGFWFHLPSELIIIDSLVGELVISFRKGWETMGPSEFGQDELLYRLWWSAGKAL